MGASGGRLGSLGVGRSSGLECSACSTTLPCLLQLVLSKPLCSGFLTPRFLFLKFCIFSQGYATVGAICPLKGDL